MNKELEALAILKQTIFHYTLGCLATREEKALKVIETALKDYEKQDNLIKIIKETIEFGIKDNKVEENENGDLTLSGRIGIILRKELAEKERTLFRDWILETCFPKELKALKIIEKKGINIRLLKETDNAMEYNELIKSHYGMLPLSQKEYELLKEVLK